MGLDGAVGSPALELDSLEAGFSFSAAAPPELPSVLGVLDPEDASPLSLAGVSPVEVELSVLFVLFVEVVPVEVVCTAAVSALVSVGGVSSGVLFGTASETLVPPQALNAKPQSSAAHAASATRALTAAPYACRRWGSR
ncbi:MAG: hypothetical protein JWN10_313 [Solirubrobacterales bacterium]|nr:hypothetical protein [Solirubrobacterales bacterium]